MTISYPLAGLPALVDAGGIADLKIMPEFVQGRNTNSFTNAEQIYDYIGERWTLTVNYTGLTVKNARIIIAFLLSLRGIVGTFMAGDSLMSEPEVAIGGTPLVNGDSQTGRTLNVKGLDALTGTIKAGTYFQLGNFLYMNLTDAIANGSGNATLDIFPYIRGTPVNNDVLSFINPKNIFRLSESAISWSVNNERIYRISFSAVEAR